MPKEEPICQHVKASSPNSADEKMEKMMKKMEIMHEETKSSLNALERKVHNLEHQQQPQPDHHENPPQEIQGDREQFSCYNCGGRGHIARYCLKPKKRRGRRYPEQREKPLNG